MQRTPEQSKALKAGLIAAASWAKAHGRSDEPNDTRATAVDETVRLRGRENP
jgi:hypothetical protein